jgi:hypothetical protein
MKPARSRELDKLTIELEASQRTVEEQKLLEQQTQEPRNPAQ